MNRLIEMVHLSTVHMFQLKNRKTIFLIKHSYMEAYKTGQYELLKYGFANNILNKSENATLQLSIFYEKVLDK